MNSKIYKVGTLFAALGYVSIFYGLGEDAGGNNGSPANYTWTSGATAGTNVLADAEVACGGGIQSVRFPDLRTGQVLKSVPP
jgi:hypothetical protein